MRRMYVANRRFEFKRCSQLFIRSHNEMLSVAVNDNNKSHWHESGWMEAR